MASNWGYLRRVKKTPDEYLERLEKCGLRPTFWSSKAYLDCLPNLKQIESGGSIWLEDDEMCLFPPITHQGKYDLEPFHVWAIPSDCPLELPMLDWEYIYDSNNFHDLSGGKWSVFRKNSRKWPQANPKWSYISIKDWNKNSEKQVNDLLVKWMDHRNPEEEIQDSEALLWYVLKGKGKMSGLWIGDRLVGINCWDESYCWTNFRYSFADPEESWLSEFLRLLFYESQSGLVNDGGTLGNPNLEKFKDKLNPVIKNQVKTTCEVRDV